MITYLINGIGYLFRAMARPTESPKALFALHKYPILLSASKDELVKRSKNSASIRIKNHGFTLLEMMIVVVILGILAAMVVPKIMSRPEQARLVKAKQDILAIQNALDLFKLDNGFYPSTDQGLSALVTKPTINPIPTSWQAYLTTLPKDPWGQPYQYLNPGSHNEIDIFTVRPNHNNNASTASGNDDANMIGNWNAQDAS